MLSPCSAALVAWIAVSIVIWRLIVGGMVVAPSEPSAKEFVFRRLKPDRSWLERAGAAYMLWSEITKKGKWMTGVTAISGLGLTAMLGVCNNTPMLMFHDFCNTLLLLFGRNPLPPLPMN